MRILIVEDEAVSRTKLATIMETLGDCRTADNGRQALAHFQQAADDGNPYHLVTLDIEMPDLSGTDVLTQIRQIEAGQGLDRRQRSKIVMVTSQADQQQVVACLRNGCDDYITKPFNPDVIRQKLDRLEMLPADDPASESACPQRSAGSRAIIEDIHAALGAGPLRLPVSPRIGRSILTLREAGADTAAMQEVVRQDMALVGRLMQQAQAATGHGYGAVRNCEQAMDRLGPDRTDKLIAAMIAGNTYDALDPPYQALLQRLWRHALATALAAEMLFDYLTSKPAMDPFTAGLLHDIGALALIQIIAEKDRHGRSSEANTPEALKQTIDGMQAAFGAKLMQQWGFAAVTIDALRHHCPTDETAALADGALVVHLAHRVADAIGCATFADAAAVPPPEAFSTPRLKLKPEQLQLVRQKVMEHMQASESGVA